MKRMHGWWASTQVCDIPLSSAQNSDKSEAALVYNGQKHANWGTLQVYTLCNQLIMSWITGELYGEKVNSTFLCRVTSM